MDHVFGDQLSGFGSYSLSPTQLSGGLGDTSTLTPLSLNSFNLPPYFHSAMSPVTGVSSHHATLNGSPLPSLPPAPGSASSPTTLISLPLPPLGKRTSMGPPAIPTPAERMALRTSHGSVGANELRAVSPSAATSSFFSQQGPLGSPPPVLGSASNMAPHSMKRVWSEDSLVASELLDVLHGPLVEEDERLRESSSTDSDLGASGNHLFQPHHLDNIGRVSHSSPAAMPNLGHMESGSKASSSSAPAPSGRGRGRGAASASGRSSKAAGAAGRGQVASSSSSSSSRQTGSVLGKRSRKQKAAAAVAAATAAANAVLQQQTSAGADLGFYVPDSSIPSSMHLPGPMYGDQSYMHAGDAAFADARNGASDAAAGSGTRSRRAAPSYAGSPDRDSKQRRTRLPSSATDLLKAWIFAHKAHPYPTDSEKELFCQQTGLNISQINNWFTNARRRLLK